MSDTQDGKTRKDANRLTHQEAIRIYNAVLAPHCKSDADGYAVYEQDWNDERLHAEAQRLLDRKLSQHSLADLRRDSFGNFRRETRSTGRPPLTPRLEALEAKVTEQDKYIHALGYAVADMERWMKHNKGYPGRPGRPQSTPPDQPVNGPKT